MSYADMFGSFPAQTRKWTVHVEASQENVGYVPAEEFIPDPFLPALGQDPFDPASTIVIPAGRFVSVGYANGRGGAYYRIGIADTGKTPITLCSGVNVTPAGMSINQMYRTTDFFMTDSNTVKYKRGFMAELPYVLAVNNSHGTVNSGDYLAGYWGQTSSSTAMLTIHTGKPVKWNPKRVNVISSAASSMFFLNSATYPGVPPLFIAAYASGALLPSVTCTFTFFAGYWWASLTGTGSSTANEFWFMTGQDADQIAGECIRIESISSQLSNNNFLRWVEMAPMDSYNFPPMKPAVQRMATTQVTNETPTTVIQNSIYKTLAGYPLSVYNPVIVQVSNATITDISGNVTTYNTGTWFTLPTNTMIDTRGYFIGLYHTVNWRTGEIDLSSAVQGINGGNINIQVSYFYIQDPRDGAVLWGAGLINLTDGTNIPVAGAATSPAQTNYLGQTVYATPSTPAYGVPAWENFTDVVGAMRVWVK